MSMSPSTTRRSFLAGGIAAVTLASGRSLAAKAAGRQPNVIFMMADDLGYADIGVFGQRHLNTPHIDSLARDGLRLTHGYANSCVCSPTRTALATGRYQQRFAVGLEEPLGPNAPEGIGIPEHQPTIASRLRDLGYHTALVGKWHLGDPPRHGPLKHGYEHFFGIPKGAADYFRHRVNLDADELADGLHLGDERIERVGYMTDLFGDEAVRLIRDAGTKPLFLSLHFTAPHWPWEGPHDQEVSRQLKSIFHRDGGSLETYAEMIRSMDANVGKVLAALKEKGMAEDTIVVFTSDNGGERFSDTWPFTGVKGELLEGGIRVPLLVRWPRRIAAGRASDQVMVSMDFVPTLVAAAGGTMRPGESDGVDLLPHLVAEAPARERTLFWRFKASEQAAVRHGEWKYLRLAGDEHLFNVVADPRERADLRHAHPEKLAKLKAMYERWNADMLPYTETSFSESVKKSYLDRY